MDQQGLGADCCLVLSVALILAVEVALTPYLEVHCLSSSRVMCPVVLSSGLDGCQPYPGFETLELEVRIRLCYFARKELASVVILS